MLPKDFTVKKETKTYEPIPEGIYQIEITDADLIENQQTKWGPKDYIKFSFVILDGKNKGKKITYKCSTSFTASGNGYKASNLYKLVEKASGKKVNEEEAFKVENIFGSQIMITVSEVQTEKGTYNSIEAVTSVKELLPSLIADAPIDTPLNENVDAKEIEEGKDHPFDGSV